MKSLIRWEKKLATKQIKDALSYLGLLLDKHKIKEIEQKLIESSRNITIYKAADLIRASRDRAIPGFQKEVSEQLQLILLQKKINPVILVTADTTLYIGDGYHRICACYSIDDAIEIACVHIEI